MGDPNVLGGKDEDGGAIKPGGEGGTEMKPIGAGLLNKNNRGSGDVAGSGDDIEKIKKQVDAELGQVTEEGEKTDPEVKVPEGLKKEEGGEKEDKKPLNEASKKEGTTIPPAEPPYTKKQKTLDIIETGVGTIASVIGALSALKKKAITKWQKVFKWGEVTALSILTAVGIIKLIKILRRQTAKKPGVEKSDVSMKLIDVKSFKHISREIKIGEGETVQPDGVGHIKRLTWYTVMLLLSVGGAAGGIGYVLCSQ